MRLPPAPLEDWLRDYYFTADIDISCSGVQAYSMAEVRAITGIGHDEIDALVFDDGYSLGTPAVRSILAERYDTGDPERIMTTHGSSEAIALVLMSLLRAGDEVVVVRPGYHSLIDLASGLGARTVTWRLDPGRGWRPSLDELAELVTERTRAIVVNFPQNPTGASLDAADQRRLVEIARSAGAYLIWDAAFAELTYDAQPLPPPSLSYDRALCFGTFSKVFGLPGLRFGRCVGPPGLLADCVRIRDYTTLHVSPLLELLALGVLKHADTFIGRRLRQATTNRGLVLEWAEAVPDAVTLVPPAGGVCAFPRLVGIADTYSFCDELFQGSGVLVVPGSCFGAPEHIRLGFGGPSAGLVEGLERITAALAGMRSLA